MRFLILMFSLIFSGAVLSENFVVKVSPEYCLEGVHQQSNGPFAIFVFCDDALGSNISVFLKDIGAPFSGKYSLGSRFWQGQLWSNDVTSFVWLENRTELLVATSGSYGSGGIYLLNLNDQESKILFKAESADIQILKVKDNNIDIKYENSPGKYLVVKIAM
ncbi:MAG: hypothetical protein GY787_31055 [Alteromonadales bacterium]|nr:hypothetical protein [Alteromonadales bacterium]